MSGQKYRPLTAEDTWGPNDEVRRTSTRFGEGSNFPWTKRTELLDQKYGICSRISVSGWLEPNSGYTFEARRPIVEDGPTTEELLDWVSSLEGSLLRGGVANPHNEWYFNYRDADGRLYTGAGHTGREAIENAKKQYDQRYADVAAKEAQRQKDVAAFNTWLYSPRDKFVGSLDAYLAGLEAGRKEKA
jgi:hypothetical protein